MSAEQQAHDEVLRLCRQTPAGGWVMRQAPENPIKPWPARCNVFNLSRYAVWPHRELVASGGTWAEVLGQLRAESLEAAPCELCQSKDHGRSECPDWEEATNE